MYHGSATTISAFPFRRLIARCVLACEVALFACAGARAAPSDRTMQTTVAVVEATGIAGGVAICLGADAVDLGMALAEAGPFTVQVLVSGADECARVRRIVAEKGLYGPVSVDAVPDGALPYVDNLVNLVLQPRASTKTEVSFLQEVRRVLAPLGWYAALESPAERADALKQALTTAGFVNVRRIDAGGQRWLLAQKRWPKEIGEWTHYLHGADGNAVANDLRVGPPRHYQWIAQPLWLRSHETDTSIRTFVSARGRLIFIENEAPISLAGDNDLPDKWVVKARDAFNGVELWKVPMRQWGWREWRSSWFLPRPGDIPLNIQKRLVAVGNDVYVTLGYKAPVSRLDARTGALIRTYRDTDPTGEILFCEGRLVVSRFDGNGLRVVLLDPDTGKTLWTTSEVYRGTTVDYYRWRAMYGRIKPTRVDPTLNLVTDGKTVALLDHDAVVGVDFRTGRRKWRTRFPLAPEDENAGGIRAAGRVWVGALIVSDGVVVCSTPSRVAAFDADSGKLLWVKPKRYIGHLWYEWKEVYVIDGLVWTWSDRLVRWEYEQGGRKRASLYPESLNGYDLRNGKLKRSVPVGPVYKTYHHHRCYRNKATVKYVISSRRGTECVDLKGGVHTVDNWVRGACHVGMMPANGLLYVPPHPCACYIQEKINGFNALAAGPVVPPDVPARPVLVRGPAFGKISGPAADPADWPTFRHDGTRSGAVSTRLPLPVKRLWRVRPGLTPTAPIVVRDRIFLALKDEHTVLCLDARDGRVVWRFTAGARVDSPPTWFRGAVYFGSNDGWVYAVRAADGVLAWKFRAAPMDRRMAAFDQIESLWPVHGSVLILDGVLYCAAGRSSELDGGIYMYGLDPSTGKVLHSRNLHGPFYNSKNIETNLGLPMGRLNDVFMFDGAHVCMHLTCFDKTLKPAKARPSAVIPGGLLDDAYFKRVPWRVDHEYGRLFVRDRSTVYFVRMFDSLRGLDPKVYFVPGRQGYLLFATNLKEKKRPWMERIRVRIRAMLLTDNILAAAGPPDEVDPEDPLGAFEGRKGGVLCLLDRATGKKIAEIEEPSPVVFNGIAAARGRLVLTEEDGSVVCFAREASLR